MKITVNIGIILSYFWWLEKKWKDWATSRFSTQLAILFLWYLEMMMIVKTEMEIYEYK